MPGPNSKRFGALLRSWRDASKLSQLELALAAEVSPRHVSFLETGRSQPSRDMVLLLSEVLQVPLRERNTLLEAAGFASAYRETDLSAPELRAIMHSVEFLLSRHEPYPAVVADSRWNLRLANRAAQALLPRFVAEPAALTPPVNIMRLLFSPAGARPFIRNWEELAVAMVQRLHREALLGGGTQSARALLEELLAADSVPSDWHAPRLAAQAPLLVPLHLSRDGLELVLCSAITTLGTPQDITLQELRMETFFPADEDTERALRALAG